MGESKTIQASQQEPKRSLIREKTKEAVTGYVFVSPFFILFFIFGLFPIIFSFYLGFQKWNGLGEMEFIGLQNFKWILTDRIFWISLGNTLIMWVLGTLPQLVIGIILAYALNSALIRMKSFFRLSIFVPYVTSTVAVAIVFGAMFNSQDFGLINTILGFFGIDPISWTTSDWGVKIAISTMVFWRWVGYNTIIYLAGLQGIPRELYEAADIDGATVRQKIQYVTLPMLRPIVIFLVFTTTIGALQLFTEPLIFLGRGAREEGITIVLYLYREAFNNLAFGPASATAIVLFILIVIISAINVFISNRLAK